MNLILSDNKVRLYVIYQYVIDKMRESVNLNLLSLESYNRFAGIGISRLMTSVSDPAMISKASEDLLGLLDQEGADKLEKFITANFEQLKLSCIVDFKKMVMQNFLEN